MEKRENGEREIDQKDERETCEIQSPLHSHTDTKDYTGFSLLKTQYWNQRQIQVLWGLKLMKFAEVAVLAPLLGK